MIFSTKQLKGMKLAARDGEIGHAREVYFDDQHWVIRHLVVETGGWFTGRNVLISPYSIVRVDLDHDSIELSLSQQEIKNAPDIDTDKPVSEQVRYYDHYGYPYPWVGRGLWGATSLPVPAVVGSVVPSDEDLRSLPPEARAEREKANPHLRSSKEVTGYDVLATDGDIGHVEDFLFDDRSWQIRHLVVDTRDWLRGRHVLVSPDWVEEVDWSGRRVRFKVSRDAVESSPAYEPGQGLSEEDVKRVQLHYERMV